MGYDLEVDMIREARKLDMLTCPYVFDADSAREMAQAGADVLVAHLGLTTKGSIGAKTALTLERGGGARPGDARRGADGAQGRLRHLPRRPDRRAGGRGIRARADHGCRRASSARRASSGSPPKSASRNRRGASARSRCPGSAGGSPLARPLRRTRDVLYRERSQRHHEPTWPTALSTGFGLRRPCSPSPPRRCGCRA